MHPVHPVARPMVLKSSTVTELNTEIRGPSGRAYVVMGAVWAFFYLHPFAEDLPKCQ